MIERLEEAGARTKRMGRAMAHAFHDQPNFTWVLPDASTREDALAWLFGVLVAGLGVRYGEVYTTHDDAGGAVWTRPGSRVGPWGSVRSGAMALPFRFGLGGTMRFARLGGNIERVRAEAAPERHWYLVALAVGPARSGQGIGSKLIAPVLEKASAAGTYCYLETFGEDAVRFYDKHGFEVVAEDRVGADEPFWGMTKKPQVNAEPAGACQGGTPCPEPREGPPESC